MRLDINLASQPYEDARQFWMRWGTAVVGVGIVTLVLVTMTITGWFNARREHRAMAEKRAMIAERDRIRTNAEEFLNRPENRSTRDTSQYLNELIERKAFSWTRVLENLEKVMPARVHLVTISPGLDDENQLTLKMTVAGDSQDRAIELARRMEQSGRFLQTNITGVRSVQSPTGDSEQVDMVAEYIPEPASAAKSLDDAKTADAKTADSKAGEAKPANEIKPAGTPPKSPSSGPSSTPRRRKP